MLEIFGAIFIIVLGTLFHFIYEWSGHNKLVGFFTAVNESTWEHLKLIIAPSFLWLIVEYFVYYNNLALFLAHFLGLLTALVFIPLVFYSYKALIHRDVLVLDILSFIAAAVLHQVVFYFALQYLPHNEIIKTIGLAGLIIIFILYLTQTYAPLHNFLSRDPITKRYGVQGHGHKTQNKK